MNWFFIKWEVYFIQRLLGPVTQQKEIPNKTGEKKEVFFN